MAKSRSGDQLLDDVELLNVHRYPDTVPPATLAHVRNSRACQKRLEELLKMTPLKKSSSKASIDQLLPSGNGERDSQTRSAQAERSGAPVAESPGFFRKIFQKLTS